MSTIVHIFTDGACRGNPGPGGWGTLLRYGEQEKTLKGSEPLTTNNRMELLAAIKGLEALSKPCEVILTTDSKYVLQGITEWVHNWKKKNWKTAGKEAVKNQDLWQTLDQLNHHHKVEWCWIKGHSGHIENELADQLANEAIDELLNQKRD